MPNDRVRVLIAARERELRDSLRETILGNEDYEIAGTAMDGQEAVQLAVLLKPDIVLVNSDLSIFSGMEAAEMIALAVPQTRSVLLGDGEPDDGILKDAMKVGVRAYLPTPVSPNTLLSTLDQLADIAAIRKTKEYRTATNPDLLPKIVVVTGGKGGVGKTTIAVSVAASLAKSHPGRVVLFDLYTQFGDVATVLDITPQKALCDLAKVTNDIDLETLEGYMVEHVTGLKVLVSAIDPRPLDAISVPAAENTLNALKRAYTHIVVDMPPILHETTLYVLSRCYQLLLITNCFDMPTLKNAKELYDKIIGTYVSKEKISVVANRVSKYDRLRVPDVIEALDCSVAAQVPNDPRLVSAINQGVPFIDNYRRSAFVKAVDGIARDIIQRTPISDVSGNTREVS